MEKGTYDMSYSKPGTRDYEGVDAGELKEKPYARKVRPDKYYVVMKGDKLRSLIIDSMKAEKLKNMLTARSRAARFKLWVARVLAVALVWAVAVQLRSLGEAVGPRLLKLRSSYSLHPPSEPLD